MLLLVNLPQKLMLINTLPTYLSLDSQKEKELGYHLLYHKDDNKANSVSFLSLRFYILAFTLEYY